MLGKRSPQGGLFQADTMYLQHVGEDSFHGILGRLGASWFRDEDFEGLYRETHGRPSVPPSQLCIALLLQTYDGVSDEEAIDRTAYDLRWKVALGLEISEKLCAKSTLQLFRSKLVLNDAYQQVFNKSIEVCREAGLLKRTKLYAAIDTTPIRGRGAVKGVESPRGVSPRGAHRTVREPLDSHGSYHPAARGVTPAAHWENNFGSRLATVTNQRDALRFRPWNRLNFLAAHRTKTRFKCCKIRLHSDRQYRP